MYLNEKKHYTVLQKFSYPRLCFTYVLMKYYLKSSVKNSIKLLYDNLYTSKELNDKFGDSAIISYHKKSSV